MTDATPTDARPDLTGPDLTGPDEATDEATPDEKLDGVLEQMRGDIAQGNVNDVADALRQRLDDTGIVVTDEEFAALLARL